MLGSNGVELSASCAVSVRALPQSIAFASDNLDMETGDVETFEVKSFVVVEPAGEWLLDSLTWNTSDAGVAIVDVADDTVKVIAVGVGECVISATTVNGLTAELPVSVSDPFVYISSISVDPTVVTAVEGEEVQLVVEILPEDATDKTLEWESSDENVATVDASGLVKVISQGEAVITVSTTDGSNLSAECRVSIVTGIDAIFAGEGDADIYTANGLLLKRNVSRGEFMQFEPGIYILRNATRSVKVMR